MLKFRGNSCDQCGVYAPYISSESLGLWNWFDEHLGRMENDLTRNRTLFPAELVSGITFNPERRQRLFDALCSPQDGTAPQFVENKGNHSLECHVNTGCGDFFRPEDVQVNINGRNVEFHAKREEKSDDGTSFTVRQVKRVFSVPETADAEKLEAHFTPHGKLVVTAPLLVPAVEEKKNNGLVPVKINRK